jgi:glycosyltransferase involved in cell wall biosynthesis
MTALHHAASTFDPDASRAAKAEREERKAADGAPSTEPDIRTLFITQWFDPEPGAIRGLPLARWLSERGHAVQVLTGFPNYPGGKIYDGYRQSLMKRELLDNVEVLRVPLYPSHDQSTMRRMANYVSFALSSATIGLAGVRRADVAYVYNPPPTALAGLVLKALKGVPFMYHIGDMWPESVTESGMIRSRSLRSAVESGIHRWCDFVYEQASVVTVLSSGFKRILVNRGVPPEKVHVIYNWADEAVFHPVARDPLVGDTIGLRDRFNVIYAGNMGVFQGLETVIEAAQLLRDIPEIQVVLVGTGPREAQLRKTAAGIGNVRFVERRQYWEMPQICSHADVFLIHLKDLPIFESTIPSKTQVALACGRPTLMAVRGEAADIVVRSGGGLTCPPEDAQAMAATIERLYRMDPAERSAMGARGREFYLRELSMENGGARMNQLLRGMS